MYLLKARDMQHICRH